MTAAFNLCSFWLTVHGAERCGRHGYLCSVPQAELHAAAGLPAADRRVLRLHHRDSEVRSGAVGRL